MMATVAMAWPMEMAWRMLGIVPSAWRFPTGPPEGAATPKRGTIFVITMITPLLLMKLKTAVTGAVDPEICVRVPPKTAAKIATPMAP